MNKKAQGLSVNLIIIVAIALVILVVVIAIFTGKMGDWVSSTKDAKTCQSACEGIGMSFDTAAVGSVADCADRSLPGDYSDLTTTVQACCCK